MQIIDMIYQKAQALSESDAQEVLDFVEFLESKRSRSPKIVDQQADATPDLSELDQFGAVYDGNFDRNACYDRPDIR